MGAGHLKSGRLRNSLLYEIFKEVNCGDSLLFLDLSRDHFRSLF